MNIRYIVACLAVWAFFFVYEGFLHEGILQPFYKETSDVWRTPMAMQERMVWMVVSQGLVAFLFGAIFTKGYERLGIWEGARYGWWIGLLFAAGTIMWYVVLPVPAMLAAGWCVGTLVETTIAGIILAAIYRP
jgi:hypothetical protein